jgi:alkyl sulfatase BDS1-like metallo-beta-lactamase superfamily hydrolase
MLRASALRLDGVKAGEKDLQLIIDFSDAGQRFLVELSNGVMYHHTTDQVNTRIASMSLEKIDFAQLVTGEATLNDLESGNRVTVSGDRANLEAFLEVFAPVQLGFNIVVP